MSNHHDNTKTLDESTVEELLIELSTRCNALVVGYILPTGAESSMTVRHHGNRATCLGLSDVLKMSIMQYITKGANYGDPPCGPSDES